MTAGPAEPRSCNMSGHIKVEHKHKCESVESDSRIWRHSAKRGYNRQLIYCPDTDGYIVVARNFGKGGLKCSRALHARNFFDHAPSLTRKIEVHRLERKRSLVG